MQKSTNFLGLKLDPIDMRDTLALAESLITKRNTQHCVLNASKVVLASESQPLKEIINNCDLVNADGMSVVWAARLLGIPVPERVAGIDFMNELVKLSSQKGYSIFLLGAKEETVATCAKIFTEVGANIIGFRNGFWSPDTELEVVREVAQARPDILLVAIPSPQKEVFLQKNLQSLNVGLAVGVGGSFDVVAGVTSRAPIWMQKTGLEWIFRLMQEPKRMLGRYVVGNTKFVFLVTKTFVYQASRRRQSL